MQSSLSYPCVSNKPVDVDHYPCLSLLRSGVSSLADVSVEAVGFLVTAVAVRLFIPSLSWPLSGIAAGLFSAKLVIKVLTAYNFVPLMDVTYEACRLSERYPKLQTVSFLFAMTVSLLSKKLGLIAGIAVGIYGAVILDVENYKLMQKETRKALLEKG